MTFQGLVIEGGGALRTKTWKVFFFSFMEYEEKEPQVWTHCMECIVY